jgi:hypothetical protein
MDCADTSASQHCKSGLNDHGHINENAITSFDAKLFLVNGSQSTDLITCLFIGPSSLLLGVHRVSVEGNSISSSLFNVTVECVEADVSFSVGEPAMEILVCCVQDCLVGFKPVKTFGLFVKESLQIFDRIAVCLRVFFVDEVVGTKFTVSDILREVNLILFPL